MPAPVPPVLPTCSDCVYFHLLPPGDQVGKGLCRYGSPKVTDSHVEESTADGRWPMCFATEWCGRWGKKP